MPSNAILALPAGVVGLFLAIHIVVPLVWGDIYPFTSAPMFRDMPEQYCNYRIFAPDGTELPPEAWLVQRVYDGNPVGYGVGVSPPAVIEQKFGVVHEEREVREHFRRQFLSHSASMDKLYPDVEVSQEIFTGRKSGTVQMLTFRRWKIASPLR